MSDPDNPPALPLDDLFGDVFTRRDPSSVDTEPAPPEPPTPEAVEAHVNSSIPPVLEPEPAYAHCAACSTEPWMHGRLPGCSQEGR